MKQLISKKRRVISLIVITTGFFFQLIPVFSQPINFVDVSLSEARLIAKKERKFLFIDFYAEWCRPCKEMEQTVFVSHEVGSFMNQHFISIRIEAEKSEQVLVKKLKINTFPTFAFYDEKGRLVSLQVGALTKASFLDLTSSLINMDSYSKAYAADKEDSEAVYNYLSALQWSDEKRAELLARKYLTEIREKKYSEKRNWKIIQQFVRGTDAILFQRILNNENIFQDYTAEFKAYALKGVQEVLAKAIALPNQSMLSKYAQYIQSYPKYFPNPDSLKLTGRIAYAKQTQDKQLVGLLKEYVRMFNPQEPEELASLAIDLSENYFDRDVLGYALTLADQSIHLQGNAQAYVAKAMIYDKLNSFKNAYANLLLAYQFANDEVTEELNQYTTQLERKIKYEFSEGINTLQEMGNDGRFTLGSGSKRLMYGYPLPKSTSHFIINVNGKLASNAPHLKSVSMAYLKGPMKFDGQGSTPRVSTIFEFEKVVLTQILTPVDKNGKEIESGFAQYYKITYSFENKDGMPKIIGLGVLFDTMLDDNDYCTIAADQKIVTHERMFSMTGIPKELTFYRTKSDTSDMMGAAILDKLQATKPDHLVVGRWPVLYEVIWKLNPVKSYIGDSGYFLQWENRRLNPSGKLEFVTYFGIPDHKIPNLRIIMENETYLTRTEIIYFEHQSDQLDLNAKMKIENMLKQKDIAITGVLLNGYADVIGDDDFNFNLSQRRIENIGKVFQSNGIEYVPKPFGLKESENTAYDKVFGNAWDRKVEIILYYKRKVATVMSPEI